MIRRNEMNELVENFKEAHKQMKADLVVIHQKIEDGCKESDYLGEMLVQSVDDKTLFAMLQNGGQPSSHTVFRNQFRHFQYHLQICISKPNI